MRESKIVLEDIHNLEAKLLTGTAQSNSKRIELNSTKKELVKTQSESLNVKKIPVRLTHLQRKVAALTLEYESLEMICLDMKDKINNLSKEYRLAKLFESEATNYKNTESVYFSSVNEIIEEIESVRSSMTKIGQLSANLGSPLNLLRRLATNSDLAGLSVGDFLEGRIIEGTQNGAFMDAAGDRFIFRGSLPTSERSVEIQAWASILRNLHEKLLRRSPVVEESGNGQGQHSTMVRMPTGPVYDPSSEVMSRRWLPKH